MNNLHNLSLGCLSSLLFCSMSALAADDVYGPLRAYAQSPVQSTNLAPVLRSASKLPTGHVELYSSLSAASVWAETEDYTLDYYQNQIELGGKWQFAERWYLDLNYRWSFAADNHLDGLTESFHDMFGIGQNGRDKVAKHRFSGNFEQYDAHNNDFEGDTLGSSISAYLDYHLYQDSHHALSVGGTLFYNHVAHGAFAGNSFEQGVQLNYSYFHGNHSLYSMLGAVHHSRDTLAGDLPLKEMSYAASLGYKYQLFANHQLFAEYHWIDGYIDDDSDLSEGSHEAVLGYRYLMSQSAIEVFATENLVNMDNSTDISFTLGYRYYW